MSAQLLFPTFWDLEYDYSHNMEDQGLSLLLSEPKGLRQSGGFTKVV